MIENLKNFISSLPAEQKNKLLETTKNPTVQFSCNDHKNYSGVVKNLAKNCKSSTHFFNYKKSEEVSNNINVMENLVGELKYGILDNINHKKETCNFQKQEIESNVNILSNRLKMKSNQLTSSRTNRTTNTNDVIKMEQMTERVIGESKHMNIEIEMTKNRIHEMKNEIFARDAETNSMQHEIMKGDSDVQFLKEETRRLNKMITQMLEDKKNMRTAVLLMKKQNDALKEKVIKAEHTNKDFLVQVSNLIQRNKSVTSK